MNPHGQFCHNPACWAYGRRGAGHIVSHRRAARRDRGKWCGQTFSATKGTALYRAHKPPDLVMPVVALLAHGGPVQALVAACGLDERGQVQADELRVRLVGGVGWVATALTVTSRLWLGGVVSAHRDKRLIHALLTRVRACGAVATVLRCAGGLSSYSSQARWGFREVMRTGQAGRPRLVLPAGSMIAQLVERYAKRRVVGVAQGTVEAVQARLVATQSAAAARRTATLEVGLWLVGTCYNCCWAHDSLRRRRGAADLPGGKWVERTPAEAAGLTEHRWSVPDLLTGSRGCHPNGG